MDKRRTVSVQYFLEHTADCFIFADHGPLDIQNSAGIVICTLLNAPLNEDNTREVTDGG